MFPSLQSGLLGVVGAAVTVYLVAPLEDRPDREVAVTLPWRLMETTTSAPDPTNSSESALWTLSCVTSLPRIKPKTTVRLVRFFLPHFSHFLMERGYKIPFTNKTFSKFQKNNDKAKPNKKPENQVFLFFRLVSFLVLCASCDDKVTRKRKNLVN